MYTIYVYIHIRLISAYESYKYDACIGLGFCLYIYIDVWFVLFCNGFTHDFASWHAGRAPPRRACAMQAWFSAQWVTTHFGGHHDLNPFLNPINLKPYVFYLESHILRINSILVDCLCSPKPYIRSTPISESPLCLNTLTFITRSIPT